MLQVAFAAIGGLALVPSLGSRRLRAWPLSEPLMALALGVAAAALLGCSLAPTDPVLTSGAVEGGRQTKQYRRTSGCW